MNRTVKQYIELYHFNGIADFFAKKKPKVSPPALAPVSASVTAKVAPRVIDELKALAVKYKDCRSCAYCNNRIKIVFGTGQKGAKCLFIGNPPNYDENYSGRPFMFTPNTPPYTSFTNLLNKLQLQRKDIYFTLISKCKPVVPSANFTHSDWVAMVNEIMKCKHILTEEIQIVQPKIIVVFGGLAANVLFDKKEDIAYFQQNQGLLYENIPVYVTHDIDEIKDDRDPIKRTIWDDLQKFKAHYDKC